MTATSVSFLLAGCATAPLTPGRAIGWDGLGRNSNPPYTARRARSPSIARQPNKERERVLLALRPYSEAWWVVHDEIEAENDRQLRTRLVICHGCLTPSLSQDATGSLSGQQPTE
nr:hypothetical protein [Bradyrhizobium sp. 35]